MFQTISSFPLLPPTPSWYTPVTTSREDILRGQIGLTIGELECGEAGNVIGRDEQRRLAEVHNSHALRAPRTKEQIVQCMAYATAVSHAMRNTPPQTSACSALVARSAETAAAACECVVALGSMLLGADAVSAALSELTPWEPVPRALVVPAGAVSIDLNGQDAFEPHGVRYELRTRDGTLHPVAVTERRLSFVGGDRYVECATKRLLEAADSNAVTRVVMAILAWTA